MGNGHATRYDFSARQQLFHRSSSVAVEQPQLRSGLQEMEHYSALSLSFNVNDLK